MEAICSSENLAEQKWRLPKLDGRLSAIKDFVRKDAALVVDVGADHAKILRSLRYDGFGGRLIATDIKAKALQQTEKLLLAEEKLRGISFEIELIQTDGLMNLPCLTSMDVIISGMGGETISDIITQCTFLQEKGIRFILQPMSKADVLAQKLRDLNLPFVEAKSVTDVRSGREYRIMVAET
jgi:tRNA A22 N-methylase